MLIKPKERLLQIGDVLQFPSFDERTTVDSLTQTGNGRTKSGYLVSKNGYQRNGAWYYRVVGTGYLEYKLLENAES